MKEEDIKKTIERYNERLEKLGYSDEALGWTRNNNQVRFEALVSEWSDELDHSTICDFGCGFGDLFGFLIKKGVKDIKYTGIDINDRLIEVGKELYPGANFWVGDILKSDIQQSFDFTFSSGVFNHKLTTINEYEFIKAVADKLNAFTKKGFAINFLSDKVEYNTPHNFNANPGKIIEMFYSYSNNIVLKNDYMPFEFTIFVRKDIAIDRERLVYE